MVQDQGVSRMGSLKGLSPWFADGHTLTASSRGLFPSLCASGVSLVHNNSPGTWTNPRPEQSPLPKQDWSGIEAAQEDVPANEPRFHQNLAGGAL